MKCSILIDILFLIGNKTGIGRYTEQIVKRLPDELFERYYFGGFISSNYDIFFDGGRIGKLKHFIKKVSIIRQLARKIITHNPLVNKEFDLYWQPNYIPLDSIKSKNTVTSIHDFSFIHYKEYHPKERIDYFEKYFFKNIYRSDFIITGSNYTKDEILNITNFSPEQVKVIYHGVDHELFKVNKALRPKTDLSDKYIVTVGSIEPRKNLKSLIKAYNNLDKSFKKEFKLVIVGFNGWNNAEILELINKDKENIIYCGYLPDEELVAVYNNASLFVYPSFYEGFGLPPVEAMACGVPVIVSNSSSLPEVGKDAVVYCDPHDVEDIKYKIEIVLQDSNLQKKMSDSGLKRAKEFTWDKSAAEHVSVFKRVCNI